MLHDAAAVKHFYIICILTVIELVISAVLNNIYLIETSVKKQIWLIISWS